MDKAIEARIAALETEISELKKVVADEAGPPTSDRRGMIKLVAATAVGAVAGSALLGAQPAAALDGDPVKLGQANDSTLLTSISASDDSALSLFGAFVGVESNGSYANAWFPGSGPEPGGTPGGVAGALYVDGVGNWWASVLDIEPAQGQGIWRKLAGPNTAGQLHVLPTPVRVYDSRPGQAPEAVGPKAPTVGNTIRVIDTTANGSGVPLGATAVLVNLTITGPQAPGFAAAWPTGPWPGTSSVNFAAGQDIAGTTVVGCGPNASIQVLSNTVTNFLVDVIGYYQ